MMVVMEMVMQMVMQMTTRSNHKSQFLFPNPIRQQRPPTRVPIRRSQSILFSVSLTRNTVQCNRSVNVFGTVCIATVLCNERSKVIVANTKHKQFPFLVHIVVCQIIRRQQIYIYRMTHPQLYVIEFAMGFTTQRHFYFIRLVGFAAIPCTIRSVCFDVVKLAYHILFQQWAKPL